jgi:peroxiredoxin
MAQAAVHQQQSFGAPPAQYQRNCPKCGAPIDHELGRCSGCGLLYGVKHRVTQQQTPPATSPARPTLPPRPQSFMGQQPPAAQAMRPQYGNPVPGVPVPSVPNSGRSQTNYGSPGVPIPRAPSFGRSPTNYGSASLPPQGGMLMPIPSVAPAAAGAASASIPMAPRPYQYQTTSSTPAARRAPVSRKGGLSGFGITMIIIMCLLVSSGIYYFFNRQGTTPTPDSAAITSTLTMQNPPITSTTETGAIIKWTTDKPSTGSVEITDASGTIKTIPDETLATSHSITISDLSPSTTYHYTVVSTDAAGTPTTSEGTLKTTAAVIADKAVPTISGINVSNITESGAIITWITDEAATSQVKYERTENVSSTTPLDKNLNKSHSVILTKLDSGITYNFTIFSKDAAGNQAMSTTMQSFKTLTPVPVGTQVGNRAPDFVLKDLSGKDVRLGDFRGKIVMINFWAVWCGPCVEELPAINAVYKEWESKGVVVLAIAVKTNEQLSSVEQFIRQNSYTFPVLYDSDGKVENLYGFTPKTKIPRTFFIDKDGIIRKIQPGSFYDQSDIEKVLNSL